MNVLAVLTGVEAAGEGSVPRDARISEAPIKPEYLKPVCTWNAWHHIGYRPIIDIIYAIAVL